MNKNSHRLQKAESKHKRVAWQEKRAAASTPDFKVEEACPGPVYFVTLAGKQVAGPFSNEEAWRWIDRKTIRRRYG